MNLEQLVGTTLCAHFDFRLVELIDAGGMGVLYRAIQEPFKRSVAVKVLRPELLKTEYKARFFQEAQIIAQLTDSNTVRIVDFGEAENLLFIVMEYIKGTSMDQFVAMHGPVLQGHVVHIARQVCGSLAEAHQLGIIHRDIKPANIIIAKEIDDPWHVKLLDFGLARDLRYRGFTTPGTIVGTPRWVSPEAIRGQPIDGRTDLYGVGLVMLHALTGRHPFSTRTARSTMNAHLKRDVPDIAQLNPDVSVSPALEQLVRSLLEKRPDDRPSSAEELLRALRDT